MVFSGTGVHVACGTADGYILVWDLCSPSEAPRYRATSDSGCAVLSLVWAPGSGMTIVCGLESGHSISVTFSVRLTFVT